MSSIGSGHSEDQQFNLVVRREISASVEQVFEFWTQPEHMLKWWGPKDVACSGVEIDLRVGGLYRIGNKLPDGGEIWITGQFEKISRPVELVYTWKIETSNTEHYNTGSNDEPWAERVCVRFVSLGERMTEVIVTHELIAAEETKIQHLEGWLGCLDGLEDYIENYK